MWALFVSFFKIGLFTFGGGYAMLPIIERELIEKRGWCDEETLLDIFAIAQCTPGVIAVNTATFIGHKLHGVFGGVVATGAVILPSLLIITCIAAFIENFASLPLVAHALAGIRVAVSALILVTLYKMLRKNVKGVFAAVLFGVSVLLALFTDISPIYFVLAAIIIGLIFGSKKRGVK